jgi:hypothetical protein
LSSGGWLEAGKRLVCSSNGKKLLEMGILRPFGKLRAGWVQVAGAVEKL